MILLAAAANLVLASAGSPAVAVDAGVQAREFTLAAAGDVTLGYHFQDYLDAQVAKGVAPKEMETYAFAKVAPVLTAADFTVFNLECPFTERGEKLPKNFNFRARPALAQLLISSGAEAVTVANNHMMDWGPDGVTDTLQALEGVHLAHFGAGKDLAQARQPAIVERAGVRIALLGYLYIGDPPIEPLAVWAQPDKPGVAGAEGNLPALLAMLQADVKGARAKADVVVVFFHFGKEGLHSIQPYQATLAHAAVDAGADLVLGSHPHVLQGAEQYHGVPIVYSLGNFVFGGNENPTVKESAIFTARFAGRKVVSTQFVPVQITRVPEAPFQPFLLEGDAAKKVMLELADYSREFPVPLIKGP